MSALRKILRALPRKVSAALLLLATVLLFGAVSGDRADAKGVRAYQGVYVHYECRTGWWALRDGSRYTYPSDGKWRPDWHTRCRKVWVRTQD